MRNRLSPLLAALALLAATLPARAQAPAAAQAGVLVVTVASDSTGQPVPRATVRVRDLSQSGQRTGADGVARLAAVPAGTRVVEVSGPGYATQTLQVEVQAGSTQEVPIYLLPQTEAVRLQGLTATATSLRGQLARNGYYDRRTSSRGVFMDAEQIAARRPRRMADILATFRGFDLLPMIYQSPQAVGPLTGDEKEQPVEMLISTRGGFGKPCSPGFFIDGTRTDPQAILDMQPGDVEAVEAYSNPATVPVEFGGSGAECGVVIVWTRSTAS